MRIALWFLLLIALVCLNVAIPSVGPARTKAEQATEWEAAQELAAAPEAQEVARRFVRRLQETRDFNIVIEEVFVKRFLDCHVRTMREGKENGIFSQEGLSVPPEVSVQAQGDELQRYLLARLSFFHLKTLHLISTRDLEGRFDGSFYTAEQEYPPGTYDLLMKNPLIAGAAVDEGKGRVNISIKSIQQLRSVLPTLAQAVSMMGEHFKEHPPEATELYRKNMNRIGNNTNNSKFWDSRTLKVSGKDAEDGSRCLGLPVRLLTMIKVPPFYTLFIVQAGTQFKIGTLLCTEPPCVD